MGARGVEVFHFPDGRELTLPVNAPVLFYLQRLRDEVHRYAIGAHRTKRAKAITASPLDEVPGIGPSRKKALLLHFAPPARCAARALRICRRRLAYQPRWRKQYMIFIMGEGNNAQYYSQWD